MRKFAFLFLMFAAACVQDNNSPEGALKEYVESRFGNVVTREYILERVTGKMRLGFENMPEEDFKKYADLRNFKKQSFKVLSKSCQEKRCFLTYLVSFQTLKGEKTEFTTEVKKIAELNLVEGKWLIADVSNIKTYLEALEPINPLE